MFLILLAHCAAMMVRQKFGIRVRALCLQSLYRNPGVESRLRMTFLPQMIMMPLPPGLFTAQQRTIPIQRAQAEPDVSQRSYNSSADNRI